MFPAQTSFIPIQVALAKFLENQGWQAIFTNYPYWYLGTTPFRYLSGPILPLVLTFLHRCLPRFSFFELFFLLIGLGWIIGALGVYWLVRELKGNKINASLSAIFYLLIPIVLFLFRFSDGLYLITFSVLPFILILYSRFLRKRERKNDILLCLLIPFIILIDSAIVPTMVLGMAAIFLAQIGWKKTEEKLRSSLILLFLGILITTLWYTPGYWLVSLTGSSLAGKGRLEVIFQLSKLLPTALALTLAIFSVRFFKKRHLLRDFFFYWLFIFGFLTLMRFISDPDFWLDWMAYGTELQFGLAILGGWLLGKWVKQARGSTGVKTGIILVTTILFMVWFSIFNQFVLGTLQKDITQAVEYRIGSRLNEIAKPGERVFLSGTTAFWLNAFFDIPQVRGGVDQTSVDSNWRKAAWEIRGGTEPEKSIKWLKELNITYLIVHTQESEEFYHDFAYPEKFEEVEELKKIYDEKGDRIYQLMDK